MMKTVSEFFLENKVFLERNYPGINLRRLEQDFTDSKNQSIFFEEVLKGIPLEYINNQAFFYRSSFFVDERVLIPRSETEILVEDAVNFIHLSDKEELRVAEIGVGSFALGLSLLGDSKKTIDFVGGDICSDALEVATINLDTNELGDHSVELCQSDQFESIEGVFDLIVSNPPYIKETLDSEGVHHQTHKFEPHIALYLNDNEFNHWFDKLFRDASAQLDTNGLFIIEGHEDSLEELEKIAQKYFEETLLKSDYTQRLRFLHMKKRKEV